VQVNEGGDLGHYVCNRGPRSIVDIALKAFHPGPKAAGAQSALADASCQCRRGSSLRSAGVRSAHGRTGSSVLSRRNPSRPIMLLTTTGETLLASWVIMRHATLPDRCRSLPRKRSCAAAVRASASWQSVKFRPTQITGLFEPGIRALVPRPPGTHFQLLSGAKLNHRRDQDASGVGLGVVSRLKSPAQTREARSGLA